MLLATRRACFLFVIASPGLVGCTSESPEPQRPPRVQPSAEEIARAKNIYRACVEDQIGIEVEELDIDATGKIHVEFGEGYSEHNASLAASVCEARIGTVSKASPYTVLGPPPNLGRPGSTTDLQKLVSERQELGFHGAVLVEVAGERRLDLGFGVLSPGSKLVPNADTAFDAGSIMKDVTAATVFLLEEHGLLDRTQTLGEWFADAPPAYREVTIDDVLTHTAGFDVYHDTEGDFEEMDREQALELIFAQEPLFEPGSDESYSNSGYTLLAMLIENATGKMYKEVIRELVFDPLGMQRSGLYGDGLWTDGNVAVGRGIASFGANDPAAWPAPTWALIGNGGFVSTVNDMLKLAKAFDGTGLFMKTTREAFHRDYLGLSAGQLGDQPIIATAGGNDFGFNAVILQAPEQATYVVAASHVLAPVSAEILGIELVQVLFGRYLGVAENP